MITRIEERPNSWGWYGKQDRTGYAVYVLGTLWASYCYMQQACAVAERLEKEHEAIQQDGGENP